MIVVMMMMMMAIIIIIIIEPNAQVLPSQVSSTVLSCKPSTVHVARKQTHQQQKVTVTRETSADWNVAFMCRERFPDSNTGAAECNRAQCSHMSTLWRTKLAAVALLGSGTLLGYTLKRVKLLALRYWTEELRAPLCEGKHFDTLNMCMEKQHEVGALYLVKFVW
jgi:hypothetical protein